MTNFFDNQRQFSFPLREKHYQYFTELFAILGLSKFENGDAVPLELWVGLVQAMADVSGYRVSFQATVLEPVAGDQNQEKIVDYREVASADPTLFVKPADSGPGPLNC